MTRVRYSCGQMTACGRPILAMGDRNAVQGLVWYECPSCRRMSGDHRRSRAWVWCVCDTSAPDTSGDTEGVRQSRSGALRAIGRDLARRGVR